jgi:hypothetical protein
MTKHDVLPSDLANIILAIPGCFEVNHPDARFMIYRF